MIPNHSLYDIDPGPDCPEIVRVIIEIPKNSATESLSAGGDKVKYFEGTPIPTSVALTGLLALAAWNGHVGEQLWGGVWQLGPCTLHPLVLLFGLSGSLMISKSLHIPKL